VNHRLPSDFRGDHGAALDPLFTRVIASLVHRSWCGGEAATARAGARTVAGAEGEAGGDGAQGGTRQEWARDSRPRAAGGSSDREMRVMKMPNGGFHPGCQVQLATDTESRAIVAVEASSEGSDSGG